MRPSSGVTPITIFTRPEACGGQCLFCPTVPTLPKSYLPHSDVRGHRLTYSSEEQMRHWLSFARSQGAGASKLEVIVLGGSFTAHSMDYAEEFISGIYRAVAEGDTVDGADEAFAIKRRPSLSEAVAAHSMALNTSPRIIGITVETRPNLITRDKVAALFSAGVTKIELGVQSLDESVLAFNDRGHGAEEVAAATAIIKSFGLKVGYHLLFGMPGASAESDIDTASTTFADARYQPDHLKIYFCEMFRREFMRERMVELYESGAWRPPDMKQRHALLQAVLPKVPRWMRISRIGRQIKADEVEGPRLRTNDLEKRLGCRCIRCREPRKAHQEPIEIHVEHLSETETHFEARPIGSDTCVGVLRLRINGVNGITPPEKFVPECPAPFAIVRELHVYGIETSVGERPGPPSHLELGERPDDPAKLPRKAGAPHQHQGVGGRLLDEAETLAWNFGCARVGVSSGPGVRQYYEKKGYILGERNLMWKTR